MSSLYAIAASLTLFAPFLGQLDAPGRADNEPSAAPLIAAPQCQSTMPDNPFGTHPYEPPKANHSEPASLPIASPTPSQMSASNALEAFYQSRIANQHRIERRVTIRITPFRQSRRNSLFAQLPRRGVTQAFEERAMANCVPVSGIAGVQTGTGNRLLLFLRDERIVSLNLERGCEARDFYSGFYVERSDDGRLCVKRDQLQSRSGAKCEVERMRRLVRAGE